MRALGLDIGDRRIGVALSDPLGILASPLLVFEHQDDAADIEFILSLVKKHQVEQIIVGLPQSMNGSIGPQAEKVKAFTEKLKEKAPVRVDFRDERLTTVTARRMLEESSTRKPGKKQKVYDAAAAAVILQSYLNEARPLEYPPDAE
ncbi:MAG: Holliday junction resolvase RuvX [Dehalococcoidales bacterium]|nr:Holliday junction resolvase RuvX [Dehalococcoidales bacterium]